MIKANELRIGNWVQHINKETPNQVVSIDGFNGRIVLRGVTQNAYQPVRFINPIPLTNKILEQCSFEIKCEGSLPHIKINDDCELVVNIKNMEYTIKRLWNMFIFSDEVASVHKLQNLYFWLTGGKELEIKL